MRRGDDLKGGYELAELVVLSEPHTQLQGSAPLLQHEAAARETLKSLFCLVSKPKERASLSSLRLSLSFFALCLVGLVLVSCTMSEIAVKTIESPDTLQLRIEGSRYDQIFLESTLIKKKTTPFSKRSSKNSVLSDPFF